jgi:hypothetical protein
VIGVKDEAKLHMLANMYVVEPCLFYTHRWGLSLSICRASREAIRSCRVFEPIETFYMPLSRLITAGRSTRALTRMHVTSRIAGSPNPVSRMPTTAIVALEDRPIRDVIGSASVAR